MLFRRLATDTRAASAAEYTLLLAIVGSALAVVAIVLGDSIACAMDRTSTIIATGKVPNSPNYGSSDPNGQANGHRRICRP